MANAPVTIYDSNLDVQADLKLAFDIGYEKRANDVWRAWFSIPINDPHASEVTALRYAEIYDGDERVDLFRIIRKFTARSGGQEVYRFECEHVLANLIDTKMTARTVSGPGTASSIADIIALQSDWQAGTCGFNEQFLYGWDRGTSLLEAMLEIPERFREYYLWTWDTTSYPWTLNLEVPETSVTAYIDYAHNQKDIARDEDMRQLVTKLYAYGSGAGTDQVDITSVEPSGYAYVTNNAGTYGTIEKYWTDQNYTTAAQLYAAAQNYIAILSEPKMTYTVGAADLYRITGESVDKFTMGALVKITDAALSIAIDARVLSIKKSDIEGKPGDVSLEIGNKSEEFDWQTYVQSNDLSNVTINDITGGAFGALASAPTTAGLYVSTDYLGYSDGTDWKTYMDIDGKLYCSGSGNYLTWDPAGTGSLSIKGDGTWEGSVSITQLTAGTLSVAMNINTGGSIKSNNFATGSAGWQIKADGTAEFQNATIRGSLNASDISGGTLNFSSISVSNMSASDITTGTLNASTVTVTNLNATNISTGTLSVDRIGSASITVDKLNINGNLSFNGTNSIIGIDRIFQSDSASISYGWMQFTTSGISINSGSTAGTDVNISANDDITFEAGGDINLGFNSDDVLLKSAVGTDSLSFKIGHDGYIKCRIDGVDRYIAFREEA